jgi:hypothetical protein
MLAPGATAHAQSAGFIDLGGGATIFLEGGAARGHVQMNGGAGLGKGFFLTFTPSVAFGGPGPLVQLPIGFEYDARVRGHLTIYPRLAFGGAIFTNTSPGGGATGAFLIEPALGVKVRLVGRWTLGMEPLCFPVYVSDAPGMPQVAYRFTGLTGFEL